VNPDPVDDVRQRRALELRKAHYVELAKFAVYSGCTELEAQQVANDSLAQLVIHESDPTADPLENTRAWLYEVTRRKTREVRRHRARHEQLSNVPDECLVDPRLGPEQHAEWMEVLNAVQKLPMKYRVPLALCSVGFSVMEIADLLGVSYCTVTKRISRARQTIRAKFGMNLSTRTSTAMQGRAE
jgi:RNA polymerase sigma factor (sigma-70 family)